MKNYWDSKIIIDLITTLLLVVVCLLIFAESRKVKPTKQEKDRCHATE